MGSYHLITHKKPTKAIKKKLQFILEQLHPQVPFILVTYNNQLYLEHMIEQLKSFDIKPIVLDNQSTDQRMQCYLTQIDELDSAYVVRMNANYGHTLISQKEIYDLLPQYFVYSDPDILFNQNLPKDFINILKKLTDTFEVFKAGFNISPLYHNEVQLSHQLTLKSHISNHVEYEFSVFKSYYASQVKLKSKYPEVYLGALDTTTALYNKKHYLGDFAQAIVVQGDMDAVHMPWFEETDLLKGRDLNVYQENNVSSATYIQKTGFHSVKKISLNYLYKSWMRKSKIGYQKYIASKFFKLKKYINSINHIPVFVEYSQPYDNLDYVIDTLQSFGLTPLVIHYQPWNQKLKKTLKVLKREKGIQSFGLFPSPQRWSVQTHDFFNDALYDILPQKFLYTDLNIKFNDAFKPDCITHLMEISERYKTKKVGLALDITSINSEYWVSADKFHYGYHNHLYRTFYQSKKISLRQALERTKKRKIQHEEHDIYYGLNYKALSYYNKNYPQGSYLQGVLVAGDFTAQLLSYDHYPLKC